MKKKPEGWLFTGPSVAALRDQLNAAFEIDPAPRLFVKKGPKGKVTLHVLSDEGVVTAEGDGGINDSHVCPGAPGCPK